MIDQRAMLDAARKKLLDNDLYLGDPTFKHEAVVWKRIGNDNCLVIEESADAVDTVHAAPEKVELRPAILSMVVHITSDDFGMTPCGNWKGPTSFCEKMSDMKLSCTGNSPRDPAFSDDYTTTLKNLSKLTEVSAKFKAKQGLFWECNGEQRIKFCHVLFEVCILCFCQDHNANPFQELPKINSDWKPETASDASDEDGMCSCSLCWMRFFDPVSVF